MRQSPEFDRQKAFYENLLDGVDPDSLPLGDAEQTEPDQGWSTREFCPDKAKLSELLRNASASEETFFATVMGFVIAKYNYAQTSVINTVEQGRNDPRLKQSGDMRAKTFPVVTRLQEGETVQKLLQVNQANITEEKNNTLFSYSDIAETFDVRCDILFVYREAPPFTAVPPNGGEIERIHDPVHIENARLLCEVYAQQEGQYRLHLGYRKDFFSESFADGLLRAYIQAARGFLQETELSGIVLTDADQLGQLEIFNQTEREYDRVHTVVDLFREKAKSFPEHDAVICENEKISYKELDRLTDRLAAALRAEGIGREKVVGVLIPRGIDMAVTALGILKAGGAYLPMDPTYPPERLNLMLQDSGAAMLITVPELTGLIGAEFTGKRLMTEEIQSLPDAGPETDGRAEDAPKPEDLFIILYTSGSTGVPKGVMLEHGNLMAFCAFCRRTYRINEESMAAAYASFGFDACMMDLYPALTSGARVCIVPEEMRLDLPAVHDYYREQGVTHAFMTTQIARQFALLGNPGSLKYLLTGGEKLASMDPPADFTFVNLYGPTETTVMTNSFTLDRRYRDIPIGRALDNVKLYIVDSYGNPLPAGAAGELWIAGPQVSRGYLNRPEKTAEAYLDNPFSTDPAYRRCYRSGDVVRYLPDGNVQFVGRRDAQVKIRGFRVELTEVEEVIRRYQGIKDVTAAAFDDPAGGKFIAAYVVADEPVDTGSLNRFILDEKPPYMVPAVIMQIGAIPYNQNQKVNRRALPVPVRKKEETVPPQTEMQKEIFDLVSEILGHQEFGIDTDIFLAGLTSIGAVQLNVKLYRAFSVPFKTRELKENNTIRKLEQLLTEKCGVQKEPEAESVPGSAPLTKTQMGILVESIAQPESTIYNLPFAFLLDASIDIPRLTEAVVCAFAAHPGVLAELVKEKDGSIRQKALPEMPAGVSAQEAERLRKAWLREQVQVIRDTDFEEERDTLVQPFTMPGGPLFRIRIYDRAQKVLFLDIHHIVSDGTSFAILLEDISAAYDGKPVETERMTSFDVGREEESLLKTAAFTQAKRYYEELLAEAETLCVPPPTVKDAEEAYGCLVFETGIPAAQLEAFCAEKGVSVSALLNAAFGYVLSRFDYKEDITYCTVYNGRSDARMERTVSMLVKTFPVRCRIHPGKAVQDYLEETGAQMIDSMAGDLYSFADISHDLGVNADILFTWQGDYFALDHICGKPCVPISMEIEKAKAPMDIDAVLRDGMLVLECNYQADRYDADFMNCLAESITCAALELTRRAYLKEIDLVQGDMKPRVESLNETAYPVPEESVNRMFEREAAKHPGKTAVFAAGEKLDYGTLNALANKAAHFLRQKGVGKDEVVGLLSGRTKEVFIGELGILKSGGAFLPMVPEYPDERIDFCLKDAGCRFLLTTEQIREERAAFFEGKPYTVATFEEVLAGEWAKNPPDDISPDALAYCIYTSGSTGTPKGVMIEHRNLRNFLDPNPKNPETLQYVQQGSVVLSVISISFDFSLMETMLPLCSGLTVCVADEDEIHNPLALAEKIRTFGVDVMSCTPSFLQNMIDVPQVTEALAGMKFYDFGAEAFPASLYDRLHTVSPAAVICNGYGPTETTISCISKVLDGQGGITIGRPAANVHAYCMDRELRDLPIGACGELVIGGSGVGRGYVNLPEKTKEVFVCRQGENLYRSGDLVRYLPNGEIEFFGRLDNQVKLRGFRIELDEIENNINSYPGIRSSKVVVRNNGSEDYLAGFFTADHEADLKALIGHLKEKLTYYMVPAVLVQLEKMPLTVNGKIDKKKLPEVAYEIRREYMPPKNQAEKEICGIFSEVLRQEQVGAADNFFEIGGTSLTATNVVLQLTDRGYAAVYKNIFDYPTPRELAAFLTGEEIPEEGWTDSYDYSCLRKVLDFNTLENVEKIRKKELENLILTGATGFLGIHILWQFLRNYAGKVYCLVRKGKYKSAQQRLQNLLMYYFGEPMSEAFDGRIVCVEGDITDRDSLENLNEADASLLINCAACVKHFVQDDLLERVNVGGVENLIDWCLAQGRSLIQISTTSVGGDLPAARKAELLHEKELYYRQIINNEYVRTKFLAERAVLEARAQKGLDGRVIRVGNLMSRARDGEFQINFITNGFMRSLKAYRQLGVFPVTLMHEEAEFSPVDSTAEAILTLAASENDFSVFHAYNSHVIYMSDVIRAMQDYGFPIRIVPEAEFAETVQRASADEKYRDALLGLIAYDSNSGQPLYPAEADNRLTTELLYRLGYLWPITDNRYLYQVIEVLDGFDFFDFE